MSNLSVNSSLRNNHDSWFFSFMKNICSWNFKRDSWTKNHKSLIQTLNILWILWQVTANNCFRVLCQSWYNGFYETLIFYHLRCFIGLTLLLFRTHVQWHASLFTKNVGLWLEFVLFGIWKNILIIGCSKFQYFSVNSYNWRYHKVTCKNYIPHTTKISENAICQKSTKITWIWYKVN